MEETKQVIKAKERERIANLRKFKSINYATPYHPVGQSFWQQSDKDISKMTSTAFEMNVKDPEKDGKRLGFHPGELTFTF